MKKFLYVLFLLLVLVSCQAKIVEGVSQARVIYHYKTVEPYLALTFDDGPNKIQTPKVLKILEKYDAKATFFVVGENIEYQKDILKEVDKQGGERTVTTSSEDEIKETIIKTNELIYSVIKKTPKLLRPPYGIVNDTLKEVCGELNMTIILWTADKDSKDWALTKDSEIINNLTKKVSNGDIFLFHDGNKKFTNTLSAIDVIIPTLKKKGYKWVTVSKLINN